MESGVSSETRREGGRLLLEGGELDRLTHVRSNLRYAYARCVHTELRTVLTRCESFARLWRVGDTDRFPIDRVDSRFSGTN